MTIIDGKKIRDRILAQIKKDIISLSFQPIFCDVLVGKNPSSVQYVQMKAETAKSVGIKFIHANFPSSITTNNLIKEIKVLNNTKNMCGIIVQLPLPENIDRRKILNSIDPKLDVDCLGAVASDKFYSGSTAVEFPTALACMTLLNSLNINLQGKKIVVIGRGELVGKPVASLLVSRGFYPDIVGSATVNKEKIIKQADVIISGMGRGKYITGDMVKKGVVLIDAGTSESEGGIIGDADLDSVANVASFVSPVPGGVGPVTVAMLLKNVLTVAQSLAKIRDDFIK